MSQYQDLGFLKASHLLMDAVGHILLSVNIKKC